MKYYCPNCGAECEPIAHVMFSMMSLIECVRCDDFFEVYPGE